MGPLERPLESRPAPWQAAELQAAFAEFEQTSHHLANSYASLERRVTELTVALNHSHQVLEAELAEKERLALHHRVLLEALPGGVIVLDGQGLVRQYNLVATDLLGPLQLGEPWVSVVARAFAPRWDDGHDVSLGDGRRVNVATAALPREPGQILLVKDVSETRHLQEQLNHHRRLSAKTELAAVLAHQVRTPLATALLQLGNMNRPGADLPLQQRARTRTLEAMRQIENLVNDMLSFARGTVVDPQPLAVLHLQQEVARAVAAHAAGEDRDAEFEFVVEPAAEALTVCGNENALVSILLNLINNARSALGGQGHCVLSASAADDRIEVRVCDNGPGISPALEAQIFEPFFTTRPQGTGLGLSVARAVARAHGGELTLADPQRGGATFVLTLPRVSPVTQLKKALSKESLS
jgi:two-component system, sensor histidine kinase FlrB